MNELNTLDSGVMSILGEVLWHAATSDASIVSVSHEHMHEILRHTQLHLPRTGKEACRFLEVASYAHITGYLLAQEQGWNVTLSDISVETLDLGAKYAQKCGLGTAQVRRVAIDFHDSPFPDGAFDVVYICSALHHTLRWEMVLEELLRVTAPDGIVILQNEPCRRDFCFYKFSTNRLDSRRPVESELERQGILKVIAEPYLGSRPEALFGMIENQKMPLPDILHVLSRRDTIVSLTIDSQSCMSSLDHAILAAPRDVPTLSAMVEMEVSMRLDKARQFFTQTDAALGIRFPTPAEIKEMAARVARRIEALPAPGSMAARVARSILGQQVSSAQKYEIAIADVFGGAVTVIARKSADGSVAACPDDLRYANGILKDVIIGYPPTLSRVLNLAYDLVPDVQTAAPEEIMSHFPIMEWTLGSNVDLRYLVLTAPTASIRLRPLTENGRFVVLLRVYGAPLSDPFRIRLLFNNEEIAGVDVHQPDSFLLCGVLPASKAAPVLTVGVSGLNLEPLATVPPVTVAALRVVCVANA